MVASDNKYMTSAVETVYLTNEYKNAIKIAREREDFIRLQAYKDAKLKELEESNAMKEAEIASKEAEIASKEAEIADKDAEIARLKAELDNLKKQ
ncbi:MAG: hypothetical protein J6I68_15400 [Butyrivibrio sp.]|uniref:hypothetical protein n=1 Tax=Butyrivibrio sp. TaxID=28121 RepID=UPI001B5C934D|nr:hypothetical protein [Butyrivibrio sp.]MBP3784619.1 hypothetical protein [Butyrivibrio sp.]